MGDIHGALGSDIHGHQVRFRQRVPLLDSAEPLRQPAAGTSVMTDMAMHAARTLALISHDNRKLDLLGWAEHTLTLWGTGPSGR